MNYTYLFVLVWLAYLICSGVLLFSRGFLLARVSKTETSTCRRLSTNPNDVSAVFSLGKSGNSLFFFLPLTRSIC